MKLKSVGVRVALGVLVGIVLACGLMLVFSDVFVAKTLDQMVDDEILSLTKQVAGSVDDRLEAEQKIVETLGYNPIFMNPTGDFSLKAAYGEQEAKRLDYIAFFFADPTGKAVRLNLSGETADVSDREYFKQGMAGKSFISEIIKDKVTGESIIMITNPVYDGDTVVGVFGGIKKANFISNICADFSWKESGIIAIYDKTTQIIGHTNPKLVEEELNLFKKAEQDPAYKTVAAFFRDKVATQAEGTGDYFFLGNDKLAGFHHITVKDWTVLISVNRSEIMKPQKKLIMFMALLALAVIIFVNIVLHFVLTKRVVNALNGTKENIEQLASLEIGKELPNDYSKLLSEFGDIYRSVQSLRQNIGDLVRQIHSSVDKLTSSSKDFSENCNSASIMATDISRTVDEIAQGATAQASDVQDGVAELSQMGEQMEGNTEQMKEMIGASDRVDQLQIDGKKQLQSLVESTYQNTEISVKIQDAIKNTEQSVDEISSAGDTIKSISDQINLLALNAAIEAARAGESGRGFAVVAEEIRKLAESSNFSTEQIRKSVMTLAERTQYAVSQIAESNRIAEEQSENVVGMSEKFEGISEALEHLRNTIERIFHANEKINAARENVSASMSNIAALTEENAASTQQISASMQEQNDTFVMIATESEALLELGEDLERITNEFKL